MDVKPSRKTVPESKSPREAKDVTVGTTADGKFDARSM
jgi:hypothetical protein